MVMELLEGRSLDDRIARGPPLGLEQAAAIVSLSLRGLAAVHDAGIVHRDLKPDNIFLVEDADGLFPKLLDFGVSRVFDRMDPADPRSKVYTTEGLIVGTPRYMSPEQARGLPDIDRRTDIWSMGVILYETLANKCPFDAEHVGDLLVLITTTDAPFLSALRPDLGDALSGVCAKAMTRDRAQRFQDARDMREALTDALDETLRFTARQGDHSSGSDSEIPAASTDRLSTPRLSESEIPSDYERELTEVDPDFHGERADTHTQIEPPPIDLDTLEGATLEPAGPGVRKKTWLAIGAGIGVAIVIGLSVIVGGSDRTLGETLDLYGPSDSPAITVTLKGLPRNATLRVDGEVASTPFTLARGGTVHRLEVLVDGFRPWTHTIQPTSDQTLDIDLEPVAAAAGDVPVALPNSRAQPDAGEAPMGDQGEVPLPVSTAGAAKRRKRATEPGATRSPSPAELPPLPAIR
jgi:serine/threonine-protein kinase